MSSNSTSYKTSSSKIQQLTATAETYIPLHKHTHKDVRMRFKIWLERRKKQPGCIVEK